MVVFEKGEGWMNNVFSKPVVVVDDDDDDDDDDDCGYHEWSSTYEPSFCRSPNQHISRNHNKKRLHHVVQKIIPLPAFWYSNVANEKQVVVVIMTCVLRRVEL